MKVKQLKWSKTRAQCPHCGGWFTRQGILGHIRFRHGGKEKKEASPLETVNVMLQIKASKALGMASEMMKRDGHLPQDMRERILDAMLIDFLARKAQGKT